MEKYPILSKLINKFNVSTKIDHSENDEEYFSKWQSKLLDFEAIVEQFPAFEDTQIDLKTCNPKTFVNRKNLINQTLKSIHPDFGLVEFENKMKIYMSNNITTTTTTTNYEFKFQTQESSTQIKTIKRTVFVIDVDFENMNTGVHLILYCRDIHSSETFTLLYKFDDYFYIKLDSTTTQIEIEKKIKNFEWHLRTNMYSKTNTSNDSRTALQKINHASLDEGGIKYFTKVEVVTDHKSIYGYRQNNDTFLKVTTSYPNISRDFFRSMSKDGKTNWEFFEIDLDYGCKAMAHLGISACAAIDFEGMIIKENKLTTCDNLVRCTTIKENDTVGPYIPQMYYFDIECLALQEDVFPTANICPIIQISYLVSKGQHEQKRGVLCLHETPGDIIYESFETEEQLLIRFSQTILEANPDALVGFNTNNFDMPYIIDRMKVLGIYDFASKFTRRKNLKLEYTRMLKQSKQFGTKEVTKYYSPGFVMFDFFEVIKADVTKKLRSYSLKSICTEYLHDDNKEELRYKDIPILFKTPEGRTKIASYCMKDTDLLPQLDRVLSLSVNCWGMCKVLGTTANVVLNRGLVYKLMCKLKRYTNNFKLLLPSFTKENRPAIIGKFKGATVLAPDLGYYEDPIVTLDFASLYPSLMIGYNLSYETLVLDKDMRYVDEHPENFEKHCDYWFVKPSVYKGVIPCLEEELGIERNKAKKNRDNFKVGSDEYNVFESLQLANKVIMNSLYGMLGSPTATVPMLQVAKTITGLGRQNLIVSKDYVEKNYMNITGETENCKVIYGDTDSIFIKMPGITIAKSISHGKLLEKHINNDLFSKRKPMKLSYEKTMCPFVITRPKGYVSAKYENDPTKFKISVSGIQLVRRDSAIICIEVLQAFIDSVFKDKDKKTAVENVKKYISDLYNENLPLEKFIITKKISKSVYKVEPPHVSAWKRMITRVGKDDAPSIGERFEYVVTKFNKKTGMSNCIVDLQLAREVSSIEIDKDYYFLTFIFNPINKLLEYIVGVEETRAILNPKNYERKETIVASKKNILSFFGVETIVTKKRKCS